MLIQIPCDEKQIAWPLYKHKMKAHLCTESLSLVASLPQVGHHKETVWLLQESQTQATGESTQETYTK